MDVDVVIFGGGGAGLWLLELLTTRGVGVILLETGDLGAGQTNCAQGIVHGGLKYTLDGVLSRSASAIREMPDLWRDCLAGRREPRLTGTRVRAELCHLWRTGSVRSAMGMVGARIGLRATPRRVAAADRPAVLAACPGPVMTVAEPVIDPESFLAEIAGRQWDRILKIDAAEFRLDGPGRVAVIEIAAGGKSATLVPRQRVVLTAGAGNGALCARLGLGGIVRQQRRPLHMLMMRGRLPPLNGHCVDGTRTRVTITSDTDGAGRTVWQVGGQLAEDGVAMDAGTFLRHGASEIRAVLPGIDLGGVEWTAYRVDRAEADAGGARPDDAFASGAGNVTVGWPTKLALVPRLAERIAGGLGPPGGRPDAPPADWPRPRVARPPWETERTWSTGL